MITEIHLDCVDLPEQLMAKFYEGDDYALELLMRRLQRSLFHQAYTQLPARHVARSHVAEDILQITWIKVAATRDRPATRWDRTKGTVTTWIGTILRNAVVSYLRFRVNHPMVTADSDLISTDGTIETVESQLVDYRLESEATARHREDLRQRLLEAIRHLPERARSILHMKMDGLSHQQIAGRLGLSKSTIGYHYREAQLQLKRTGLP